MTPSTPAADERGEGVTDGTLNKNSLSEQETTSASAVSTEVDPVSTMLATAALGYRPDGSELFDVPPDKWWLAHSDALVRAFMSGWEAIPKFATSGVLPTRDEVERMISGVRAIAPGDDEVVFEVGTWVRYNQAQPKKGGTRDAVLAFRNWCAKRAGAWALERDRRLTRQKMNRKGPGLDPLAAHNRLMERMEVPYDD